jgi:iduronate 2-sulfatase
MIRSFILSAALLTACHAAGRPNILLILVDDLKPALGVYGDKTAITPNMDKLAARGMRFDMAYCNQAVCAPSRFNLMLGLRSTSLGLYGFGRDFRSVEPDAVTLPQHFMKNGYRTESMGKIYHIGHGCHGDPQSWSVPHYKDLIVEYLEPQSNEGKLTREEALFTNAKVRNEDRPLPRGAAWESPDVADNAYADGRVAELAVKRLHEAKERPGQPFFMAIGFARPHLPYSVPKKYWDLYDPAKLPMPDFETAPEGAPDEAVKRGGEIGQYKPIPEDSSKIYPDPIKRKLIHADNTIVVLWGDHGYHLGELGIWTKHVNYELANHIPLVMVAPGVTMPGSSNRQLAETVDIYPTLAELAGLPKPTGPQKLDGLSLVPVLKDPAARVRDHAYHCFPRARMGRAIRTDRYRLVEWKKPGAPAESAAIELYDYQNGPVEKKNLAAEKPEVVAELRAILNRHPEAKRP